ncbi:MAG TPA: DUF2299 family protein [Nitrososphaeraceae archaeon]|nr:DUF2299 family protein [Nitrososphaeraceae archaeon]
MSKPNEKKEVIKKIQKWLSEEFIEFINIDNPLADYQINTKNPNQTICLPKNKIDSIEFVTAIFFTTEDQKTYIALKNTEEKLRIIWELQRSLLEINLEYEVKPNFDNLESIILKKTVYFDNLIKDKFMDTIFTLQRGFYLVELMLRQLGGKYYSNSNTKFML